MIARASDGPPADLIGRAARLATGTLANARDDAAAVAEIGRGLGFSDAMKKFTRI